MEFAGKQSEEGSSNFKKGKERKKKVRKKSIVKYSITLLTSLKLPRC